MDLAIHVDLKCLAPTVEALKCDVREWAALGATDIVFEWENMFPYPGLERAWRPDAYTPAEVRDIIGTCRACGLRTMPLMQSLGHLEWLLSHDAYASMREFAESPGQIRACTAESTALLLGCLDALLEAHHDSPYIHLGADEARRLVDIDRPECSAKRAGPGPVFLRHLRPLFERVLAAGKRPVIWADMVLAHPEALDEFPREVVFCDWLYSQTSQYAESCQGWGLPRLRADTYETIPAERKALFERFWRMDASDFPNHFYQVPYLPFLRERGFDVIGGPATLYAGNALAGTHLPNARANARVWLRAGERFGALGILNTCWAVRGALRETSRTGHRAFLLQGRRALGMTATDDALSTACWTAVAGGGAALVAEAVDALAPPVDTLSRTAPLHFDTAACTHRPAGYDTRWDDLRRHLEKLEESDPAVAEHTMAIDHAARAVAVLTPYAGKSAEAQAWLLGAREVDLRARVWLAALDKAQGRAPSTRDRAIIAERLSALAEDVTAFMGGRYTAADVRTVRADRYEGLARFLERAEIQ